MPRIYVVCFLVLFFCCIAKLFSVEIKLGTRADTGDGVGRIIVVQAFVNITKKFHVDMSYESTADMIFAPNFNSSYDLKFEQKVEEFEKKSAVYISRLNKTIVDLTACNPFDSNMCSISDFALDLNEVQSVVSEELAQKLLLGNGGSCHSMIANSTKYGRMSYIELRKSNSLTDSNCSIHFAVCVLNIQFNRLSKLSLEVNDDKAQCTRTLFV